MKRYRLKRDLPTFKEGELFHTDENGNLWRDKGQKGNHWQEEVMAYHHKTIERFPNILTDWFGEYEERDPLSKEAFIEYLRANPEQRLMQAVCNFVNQKLDQSVTKLTAELLGCQKPHDTWYWECDKMLKEARQQEIKEPEFTTFEEIEEKRKQMKNQLREWAEKNDAKRVAVFWDKFINTDFVRFRKCEDYDTYIEIVGWPRAGLEECQEYSIEYLLGANKTDKE